MAFDIRNYDIFDLKPDLCDYTKIWLETDYTNGLVITMDIKCQFSSVIHAVYLSKYKWFSGNFLFLSVCILTVYFFLYSLNWL